MILTSNISNIAFLVIYPAFFLYNFAVISGYIQDQGFSSHLVKLFALVFGAAFVLKYFKIIIYSRYALFVFLLLIYMAIWTILFEIIFGTPPGTFMQSISTVVSLFVIFSIGIFINTDKKYFRNSVFISSLLICIIIFTFQEGAQFVPASVFEAGDDAPTYQSFSMWATVTFIFAIALIRNYHIRILAYIISLTAIFFLSARSELLGFIAASFVVEYAYISRRVIVFFCILLIVILLVIFLIYNRIDIIYYIIDNIGWSRQINVLDLSMDNSWNARLAYTEYSWNIIKNNVIFGDFGAHYYADVPPMTGAYAHNALSAWVNYGIIGFLAYTGVTIWAFLNSMIVFRRHRSEDGRLSLFVNSFTLVLIISAKSVFWPLVALGWGLFVRQRFIGDRRHDTGTVRARRAEVA